MQQSKQSKQSAGKVVSLSAAKKPTPSLKELVAIDKDVLEFLKLVKEEDLREEALRLLNRAITKKRPLIMGDQG